MPVSFLLGIAGDVPEFAWVKPVLRANRPVYIGLWDLDSSEKQIMKRNGTNASACVKLINTASERL